jgi:hypothetical protein
LSIQLGKRYELISDSSDHAVEERETDLNAYVDGSCENRVKKPAQDTDEGQQYVD